jgi:hypothetical protein
MVGNRVKVRQGRTSLAGQPGRWLLFQPQTIPVILCHGPRAERDRRIRTQRRRAPTGCTARSARRLPSRRDLPLPAQHHRELPHNRAAELDWSRSRTTLIAEIENLIQYPCKLMMHIGPITYTSHKLFSLSAPHRAHKPGTPWEEHLQQADSVPGWQRRAAWPAAQSSPVVIEAPRSRRTSAAIAWTVRKLSSFSSGPMMATP